MDVSGVSTTGYLINTSQSIKSQEFNAEKDIKVLKNAQDISKEAADALISLLTDSQHIIDFRA